MTRWTAADVRKLHEQPKATKRTIAPPKAMHVGNLMFQCMALKLPEPVPELRFWEGRKHQFDLAWPDRKLAVEVEGIVYSNKGDNKLSGRHVSVTGFTNDCEKYAEAAIRGWRLIRVTPAQVKSGQAVTWIEKALREVR